MTYCVEYDIARIFSDWSDADILNYEKAFSELATTTKATSPVVREEIPQSKAKQIAGMYKNEDVYGNYVPKSKEELKLLFQTIESSLSNGIVWETEAEDFIVTKELEQSLYNNAINHLKTEQTSLTMDEALEQFNNWTGTPIDILSLYGDIDYTRNYYDNYELNVPLKIFSQDDEMFLQADLPWVRLDNFEKMDIYPNELNLKSVLSLLPFKINSQQLKASFIDGQFRVEMPIKQLQQKSKKAL